MLSATGLIIPSLWTWGDLYKWISSGGVWLVVAQAIRHALIFWRGAQEVAMIIRSGDLLPRRLAQHEDDPKEPSS